MANEESAWEVPVAFLVVLIIVALGFLAAKGGWDLATEDSRCVRFDTLTGKCVETKTVEELKEFWTDNS